MLKNLIWLLELRVWFVNVLLASETYMCIDIRYLTFKIWMDNVPTNIQFDVLLLFQHLNETYFIVKKII